MIISMRFLNRTSTLLLFCILLGNSGFAQEKSKKEEEEAFRPSHQIGFALSHSHVFEGRNELGEKENLSLPSFSIDYTYNFSKRWAIGLHTDIIVEKFKVEHEAENGTIGEIERSYPIAPAAMGIYRATEHWSFLLGMGGEFASERNFVLTRAGVEYSAEISKGWEVFGSVSYDFKWNAYDTWGVGIGIVKSFGSRK